MWLLLILYLGLSCGITDNDNWQRNRPYECDVDQYGRILLEIKDKKLICDLKISYPGGWNHLGYNSPDIQRHESEWSVSVHKEGDKKYIITASGKYYWLRRTVQLMNHKIVINDEIENSMNVPLGCIIENRLKPSNKPFSLQLAGHKVDSAKTFLSCAENPTVFYGFNDCGIGIIVEDDIYRLQLILMYAEDVVSLYTNQFGLAPEKSYTTQWSIYPTAYNDYFGFINNVRSEWGITPSVDGPFSFMSALSVNSMSKETLKKTLLNPGIKIIALHPWVNYYSIVNELTEEDFIEVMQEAIKRIKNAAPDVKVLGMIHPAVLPHHKTSILYTDARIITNNNEHYFSEYYSKIFLKEKFDKGWRIYYYYPQIGNSHLEKLKKDIDLCIDKIGTDGVYFDEFNFAFRRRPARYSYDKWDNHTVDIDTIKFTIERKLSDLGLITLTARRELVNYVIQKGGIVIANTAPATSSMQNLPIMRFVETSAPSDYCTNCSKAHLTSPIGLGYPLYKLSPADRNLDYVMRDVYAKLEQGLLYFYYGTFKTNKNIINEFYPITPKQINVGTIIGKYKIITNRSGYYTWHDNYLCLVYKSDRKRNDVVTESINSYTNDGIRVNVHLADQNIAVIKKLAVCVDAKEIPTVVSIDEFTKNKLSLFVSKGELSKITIQDTIFNNKNIKDYKIFLNSNNMTKEITSSRINDQIIITHSLKTKDRVTIIGQ